MLLIPIAGFSSNIISNQPLLIAVSFGLAYVVIPAILLQVWPAQKGKKFKSMQDALWDGELVTYESEIRDVAQIEETEDEGLHFLIATETGETLFLSGQYLYGPVERHAFPSQRVRVFRHRQLNVCYGIEPVGQSLKSWPLYDSFTEEKTKTSLLLEDGQLYPQSISHIVAEFGLKPVQSGPSSEPRAK
jgi:hypothetical protein